MLKKELLNNLKSLGLEDAIADPNASVDGTPVILLRWNGKEEYYHGQDIYQVGEDPFDTSRQEYQDWLVANFK